jgi:hypothetical protein
MTSFGLRSAFAVLLCLSSEPVQAGCTDLEEEAFISAAIEFYVAHGQPSGTIEYLDNGNTVQKLYQRFGDVAEFKSLNPNCCGILGLSDGEGRLYSLFQTYFYDVHTSVGIKPFVRQATDDGFSVVKGTPMRIPMTSCAKVIPELIGN